VVEPTWLSHRGEGFEARLRRDVGVDVVGKVVVEGVQAKWLRRHELRNSPCHAAHPT
jgi:hypothetical protein